MDKNLTKAFSDITEVFTKLAGPLAGEFGQMLGDKAFEYRMRNAIKIFQRVQKMLSDAGIDPQQIASRFFLPALQAASIEDNETLQEKWAALLANASDPNHTSSVLPSFVEILKEMTPDESKFLACIFERFGTQRISTNYLPFQQPPVDRGLLLGPFNDLVAVLVPGEPVSEIENNQNLPQLVTLMVDDLVRMGLLDRLPWYPPAVVDAEWIKEVEKKNPGDSDYFLTPFGIAFMQACTAPQSTKVDAGN